MRFLLHEAIVELWRRRSGEVVTGIRRGGRKSLRLRCSRRHWGCRLLLVRGGLLGGGGRVKVVRVGRLGIHLLLLVLLGGGLLLRLLLHLLLLLLRGKGPRVERGLVF